MYILWSLKIVLKIAESFKQTVNWQWDKTRFGMRNRLLSRGRYFWFFSPILSRPLQGVLYCRGPCVSGGGGHLLPGEVMCYFQSIVSTSCGSWVIGAGCCRLWRTGGGGGESVEKAGKWSEQLDNSDWSATWFLCLFFCSAFSRATLGLFRIR